jgi:hypothetical protein
MTCLSMPLLTELAVSSGLVFCRVGSAGGLLEFDGSGSRPARGDGARPVPPHPSPLPKEREPRRPRCRGADGFRLVVRRNTILPLPKGEGWGEGKRDGRTTRVLHLRLDARPSPAGFMVLCHSPFHASGFAEVADLTPGACQLTTGECQLVSNENEFTFVILLGAHLLL